MYKYIYAADMYIYCQTKNGIKNLIFKVQAHGAIRSESERDRGILTVLMIHFVSFNKSILGT